jgi:flagellar biosynthesis protein FliQ
MRKILALVLSFVMLVSMVPAILLGLIVGIVIGGFRTGLDIPRQVLGRAIRHL